MKSKDAIKHITTMKALANMLLKSVTELESVLPAVRTGRTPKGKSDVIAKRLKTAYKN